MSPNSFNTECPACHRRRSCSPLIRRRWSGQNGTSAVSYSRDSCRCPVSVGYCIPSPGTSQLAILIFSIFIAVNVREIAVGGLFHRTDQDFLDVFLFTWRPRPRPISSLCLSSSVAFSYLLFFVWIVRVGKSPPSIRFGLLQSSGKNAGLNTIPSIPNRLVSLSLTDGEDWTVSPAFGVSRSHFLSIYREPAKSTLYPWRTTWLAKEVVVAEVSPIPSFPFQNKDHQSSFV
jgi:hypothetical protein